MCVYVCVCVRVKEHGELRENRGREKRENRGRERGGEGGEREGEVVMIGVLGMVERERREKSCGSYQPTWLRSVSVCMSSCARRSSSVVMMTGSTRSRVFSACSGITDSRWLIGSGRGTKTKLGSF